MKTVNTTAGNTPVKLRITSVAIEEGRGVAYGIFFLPKTIGDKVMFPKERGHPFSVDFRIDGPELTFTGVRITGKKQLDFLVLESVKGTMETLIMNHLPKD